MSTSCTYTCALVEKWAVRQHTRVKSIGHPSVFAVALQSLQLRAQHERVENLVDDVVQGYHSGFNKAIHNYSRILDLFSTAQTEVCTANMTDTNGPCSLQP